MKFFILVTLFLFSFTASALEKEKMKVIISNTKNATTDDEVSYSLVVDLVGDNYDVVTIIATTEAVASELKRLSKEDGIYVCDGKRFKSQIFELSNCNKQQD